MNLHSIENEKIVSRTDDSVRLEFFVPAECDFFDGHFPEAKLLPAVGQFEIISRFAKKYFNVSRSVSSIKRMKFSSPILPDTHVVLDIQLKKENKTVVFSMSSKDEIEKSFCSGSFTIDAAGDHE